MVGTNNLPSKVCHSKQDLDIQKTNNEQVLICKQDLDILSKKINRFSSMHKQVLFYLFFKQVLDIFLNSKQVKQVFDHP